MLTGNQTQNQSADDSRQGVLAIRSQLNRQQGESPSPKTTQETGHGNSFLLEFRKELLGITPIRRNGLVAIRTMAQWTDRTQEGKKINPAGLEAFLVFPNRGQCVKVGKLNRSAPCPPAVGVWRLNLFTASGGSWLFYRGQFRTSLFYLPLYHRLLYLVNIADPLGVIT